MAPSSSKPNTNGTHHHKTPTNRFTLARGTYTPLQLQQYFSRIQLPSSYRSHPLLSNPSLAHTFPLGLDFLTVLQKYEVANVPFESLALHYDPQHRISIDPQDLFEKIVARGAGRGGYCMETSTLFAAVLRSLGYRVFSSGARVNDKSQPVKDVESYLGPSYMGWDHMVNIVTIANQRYLVDVGFGSSGPHHPLPLIPEQIHPNIGSQVIKLSFENIPDNEDPDQKLWIYKYRHGGNTDDTAPWIPGYCFSELEFLPPDFSVMNMGTSTGLTFFTTNVLCGKMIMENEEMVGDLTLLNGDLKRRIRGESVVVATAETEQERIEILERYLGVTLALSERKAISGMPTELR